MAALARALFDSPLFLRACMFVGPLGFVAVLAGWTTTEVGRQPWIVYGLMRTADAVSPSLTALGRAGVAAVLHGRLSDHLPGRFLVMARIIRKGPEPEGAEAEDSPIEGGRPSEPITVQLHAKGEA